MNNELEIKLKKLSKRVTKDSDAVVDLVKQINFNTATFDAEIIEIKNRLDKLDNNSSIKTVSRAEMQRYECLRLAFETIGVFATPSLSPDLYESFENLQKELLNIYKPKEDNNEQN